jgi:hypothetical protein
MRYATVGPISVQDWLAHADTLQRHFFNTPRRRPMQQATVYGGCLPTALS